MNTLQNMRVFCCVAEAGSFTAAAALLGTHTANISRATTSLEAHLHTRLLNRTTRRLALTEAGERYRARCEQVLRIVDEAEAEAAQAHARASGLLKVHAMPGIGQRFVIEAITCYRRVHPEVDFDLTLSNEMPGLVEEGYDVSIVLAARLPDSGFVSQRLGGTYSIVCASPQYVQAHGLVQTPQELSQHTCLRLVSPVVQLEQWLLEGPEGQEMVPISRAPFQVNSAEGMNIAIRSGMGIGVLPLYTALSGLRDGSLVRMLPDYRLQALNLYAIYPSRKYLDAKIRTWIDHLRESLPAFLAGQGAEQYR